MKTIHPDITRDTSLDKPDYPALGYHWVPAAIDGSIPNIKIGYAEIESPSFLGVKKKTIDNRAYLLIGAPTRKAVVTAGTLAPFKDALTHKVLVGDEFLKATKFSLYGVPDAPLRSDSAKRKHIRKHSYVIQDSGGFQLATGVQDFVDPRHVSRTHSIYADSGVALDIPGSSVRDHDLVMASARMLVANNKIMREETDKAVRLLNVCHGYNLQTRLDYLKIILKGEPLDSLCIGGLRQPAVAAKSQHNLERSTPTGFTAHVLLSMFATEKLYYHYHVLGVAADWQMAILSLASAVHQKLITSDSATHALTGKSGALIGYGSHKSVNYKVGRSMEDFVNARCACPVCAALKYEFPFRDGSGSLADIHNGFALNTKARTADALAKMYYKKLRAPELANLLLNNTGVANATPLMIRDFYSAVDLVMNAKSAESLMHHQHTPKKTSLFGHSAKHAPDYSTFRTVLGRYEKYHKKSFFK